MEQKVHNHASVVLVHSGDKIFSNIYDNTYPKEIYRGRLNLIGGGQSPGEKSPRGLLEREITEEFQKDLEDNGDYDANFAEVIGEGVGAQKASDFAPIGDINFVRKNILSGIKPYNDFFVTIPAYKDKPEFNVIFSTYISEINKDLMNLIQKNLDVGKSLVSEGTLTINPLNDIVSGKELTAWATGHILGDYFNKEIPNPEKVIVRELGVPRKSMEDYFSEFDYFIK